MVALFQLGQCVATPGAIAAMEQAGIHPASLLDRHISGDDGELDVEDKAANAHAIAHGERVLSAYPIAPDVRVWIITEWNRSATTILLPSEY